jgi:hypothetical protein
VIATLAVIFAVIVALSVAGLYHLHRILDHRNPRIEEETQLVTSASNRSGLFKLIATVWSLTVLAIGVLFVIVSLYWPSAPEVSMCNAELMWKDALNMIINSVATGKTTVESEVLITVYNPNRIDLKLHSVNGNIFYKGSDVGTIELNSIYADAGTASDGLGVISFSGFDRAAEIFYDFNVGHKLLLEFELFVKFSIGSMGEFNLVAPRFVMNVNDPPPQEHCKCKDSSFFYRIDGTEITELEFE